MTRTAALLLRGILAAAGAGAQARRFTPMSYFALGLLGLGVIASLAGPSLLKGLAARLLGLMVATGGSDPVSGVPRFTSGQPDLLGGVAPILVMVGLFAVSERFLQASRGAWNKASSESARIRWPGAKLRRRLLKPQLIGSTVGTVEGVIPGAGGTIASFLSYNEARRWSRAPEEFGRGSPEGVAAPETANNTVRDGARAPAELRDPRLQLGRGAARHRGRRASGVPLARQPFQAHADGVRGCSRRLQGIGACLPVKIAEG